MFIHLFLKIYKTQLWVLLSLCLPLSNMLVDPLHENALILESCSDFLLTSLDVHGMMVRTPSLLYFSYHFKLILNEGILEVYASNLCLGYLAINEFHLPNLCLSPLPAFSLHEQSMRCSEFISLIINLIFVRELFHIPRNSISKEARGYLRPFTSFITLLILIRSRPDSLIMAWLASQSTNLFCDLLVCDNLELRRKFLFIVKPPKSSICCHQWTSYWLWLSCSIC